MTRTLKALSALLTYPTEDLKSTVPAIIAAVQAEKVLSEERLNELGPLLRDMAEQDLFDLQERYVLLFDRSRSLSLNLFEHVHGESRARGSAMVDLLETYRAAGLEPVGPELPDFLPILLEFLSLRPLDEARDILSDAAHILAGLADRLARRASGYAAVLQAVVALAAAPISVDAPASGATAPDDDPDDLAALDAAWEEAMVTFGPDSHAGCPVSRDLLARISDLETVSSPRPAN